MKEMQIPHIIESLENWLWRRVILPLAHPDISQTVPALPFTEHSYMASYPGQLQEVIGDRYGIFPMTTSTVTEDILVETYSCTIYNKNVTG